jgi:hypothetical protein
MCKRISVLVLFLISLLQAPQPFAQETPAVPQSYLLLVKVIRGGTDATLEHSCILVKPEGSFRMERSFQRLGGKPNFKIYEGQFSDAEISQLKAILEDNRLAGVHNTPQSEMMVLNDTDLLSVSIYRVNHYQKFAYLANSSQKPFREIIKPFNIWLKEFRDRKLPEVKSATPNGCYTPEMTKQIETMP